MAFHPPSTENDDETTGAGAEFAADAEVDPVLVNSTRDSESHDPVVISTTESGRPEPAGPQEELGSQPPDPISETAQQDQGWIASTNRIVANSNVITPARNSRFVLREVLGRGGFGEVWETVQTSLWRLIAVKRPRLDLIQSSARDPASLRQQEIQFYQEAMTMAALDHPNIVPVYDLGVDGNGLPIVAMKKVLGRSWQDLIMEEFNAGSVQQFLERHVRILIDTANALAFAHSRGIIHRDVKPAQVIVGEFGETLLTDWGVAVVFDTDRAAQHNPLFLESGYAPDRNKAVSPAGTWAFMAPEQTLRTAEKLGPWTDIYLVGGTLYYLLTGRPPHDGRTPEETMQFARNGFVLPPQQANAVRYIPADLAFLAMRCMAPSPNQRPESMESVIRDLQAWVSGASRRREAVEILRDLRTALDSGGDPDYEKLAEWEDSLARATALCPGEDEAYELGQILAERHALTALRNEDLNLARAHAKRLANPARRNHVLERIEAVERSRRQVHFQRVAAVSVSVTLFVMVLVLYLLANRRAAEALAGQYAAKVESQRRIKQAALADERRVAAEREQYLATLQYAQTAIGERSFAQAMRSLLSAVPSMRGWEWEWMANRCHQERFILPGHKGSVHTVRWLGDGRRVVSASEDAVVRLWSVQEGTLAGEAVLGTSGRIERLILSRDGRWIAASLSTGQVALIPVPNVAESFGGNVRTAGLGSNPVRGLDFSSDSQWLVAMEGSGEVVVWSLEQFPSVHRSFKVGSGASSVVFAPNGRNLVTVSAARGVEVWDWESGKRTHVVASSAGTPVTVSELSPEGRRVAVGKPDGSVAILDFLTGAEQVTLPVGDSGVTRLRFSPNGETVVVTYRNRSAVLAESSTGRMIRTLDQHRGQVTALEFSPKGRRIVTGGKDGNLIVHDWVDGREPLILPGHSAPVSAVAFSPDGMHLASGGEDGTVRIWFSYRPAESSRLTLGNTGARWVFPMSSGDSVVVGGEDGVLRRYTDPTGFESARLTVEAGKSLLAGWNPASGQIAVMGGTGPIRVFDGATFQEVRQIDWKAGGGKEPPSCVGFGPGSSVMAGFPDGWVRTWALDSGNLTGEVRVLEGTVRSMDLSPSGSMMALVDSLGWLAVVDGDRLRTGSEATSAGLVLFKQKVTNDALYGVRFRPDGKELLTVGGDNRARIHSVETGAVVRELLGHLDEVRTGVWHPNSQRVVTAGKDATIRIWSPVDGRELLSVPSHSDTIHQVAFGPGGLTLFSASQDRSVSIMRLPLGWEGLQALDSANWEKGLSERRRLAPEAGDRSVPEGYARARYFVDRQDLPGRIEYLRGIRQLTEDLVDTNEVGVDLAIRLVAHGAAKFRTLPVLDRQIARPLALEVLHPMAEAVMNTGHATTGALSLCVDAYRLAVIQWKMRRITAHDSAVILITMADLLDGLGMSADARAVRRRAWMCAILSVPRERYLMDQPLGLRGPEFIEQIERRIRQSGDSLPPQPASELIFGTNVTRTNWLPGWITYDMWRDADEAGRDRLTNEIHQRLTGFLNDSVPLPDLDKILTEVSATPPVGPETEDALRREGLGLLGEVKRFVGLGPVAPSP